MPLEIFDKLRKGGSMFRIGRPENRFDAAICSALLAPDVLGFAPPTDFEYVSGGCWSEDLEATVNTPRDSFELGYLRSSFGSRHDFQFSDYGREECTGISDVTEPVRNHHLDSMDHSHAHASGLETRSLSSRQAHRDARLDQPSVVIGRDPTTINSCAGYTGLGCDRIHPDESAELDCDVWRKSDPIRTFKTRKVLHMMRTSGQKNGVHQTDVSSDTDPELHALPAVSVPAVNTSTDAVSITASSAVLSPAMMPKVVHGEIVADKVSDEDSVEVASLYSVEADEMIGMQPQAWKHLFRDVLHRARLLHRPRGQKTGSPSGSFTI